MSALSLHEQLCLRLPKLGVTPLLIVANILIFVAMLFSGAQLWHTQNATQLAWGANFGPATQDGEWWRLGSALFLHFGLLHLVLNMCALWDSGRWVERMYGRARFTFLYFVAGLNGNLLSLVAQSGKAVSGGASGAIFGLYGALISYLWLERSRIQPGEFRWLFRAAIIFAVLSIALGLLIPGIDNAAHIGGLATGLLMGVVLINPEAGVVNVPLRSRSIFGLIVLLLVALMVLRIPEPAYNWSDEKHIRLEIGEFLQEDALISQDWENLLQNGRKSAVSLDQLADAIDQLVAERYEQSIEEFLALPHDDKLPSAPAVEHLMNYAEQRRDASRAMVEGLRARDKAKFQKALEQARQSGNKK